MFRINAKLDIKHLEKLEALKKSLNASTTEVIVRAIDELHEKQICDNRNKINKLLNSGFVACGEFDSDLSSKHKDYLKEDLSKKHARS